MLGGRGSILSLGCSVVLGSPYFLVILVLLCVVPGASACTSIDKPDNSIDLALVEQESGMVHSAYSSPCTSINFF